MSAGDLSGALPATGRVAAYAPEEAMSNAQANVLEWIGALDERAEVSSRRGPKPVAPSRRCHPNEVAAARSLFCPEYDRCLDLAIIRAWRGWSCERCEHFALAGELRRRETREAAVNRLPSMEMPVDGAPRGGRAGRDG